MLDEINAGGHVLQIPRKTNSSILTPACSSRGDTHSSLQTKGLHFGFVVALVQLGKASRSWGFGFCFLFWRNFRRLKMF